MCVNALPECMYVYHVCANAHRSERRTSALLELDGCEPPSGCWEPNPGLLQEQPVVLAAKTSLQLLESGVLLEKVHHPG